MTDDVPLLLTLADAADSITTARFLAADLHVTTKPDSTPVTDADASVERALRDILARERPGDAVLGEEGGLTGRSARQWVVDPVDGTKNFLRGVPVWATLIALEVDEVVTAGMVSAPALGRRWWAARGEGAWSAVGGGPRRRLRVSRVADVGDAFVSFSSLEGWERLGRLPGLVELTRRAWRTRAFGDFWSHLLVAEGGVDISCEPEVSHWDVAALQVIVEEAGGRFSDLGGRATPDGGSVVCTNGLLHDTALGVLSP